MIKQLIVDPQATEQAKDHRPAIIKWRNENMIRVHSLRATVKEILAGLQVLDVIKIGVIGDQSTGKSSLEDTLGHLIHKMAPIPFSIRSLGEDEFMEIEKYLLTLQPTNYVLKFRDLSFLKGKYGSKKIEELKAAITKIRHLPGGKDVKIVLIYDYHYTMGLDKYLRQANFRYFTSVGSSEKENMLDIVGKRYEGVIDDFSKTYVEMTTTEAHKATFRISKNRFFSYHYKNPFVPVLFWNNSNLRVVVFPLRTWIDPICSICSTGDNSELQSEIDIKKFREERDAKFGERIYESAVKVVLFAHGITTYSGPVTQAIRDINRSLEMKIIRLEDLATVYGLKPTNTYLKKKPSPVLFEDKNVVSGQ